MYAIAIGAGDEAVFAIKRAQSKGLKVLAFDGDPGAEGLRYADESFVTDIRDPGNIFEVIDKKEIPSDEMFVLPVPIGRYLISTGAFNDHYGLTGPGLQTTEICTDKWLFHQTLAKDDLRNIRCVLLKKGQIPVYPDKYPYIIKPRYGAGSREVLHISSSKDLYKISSQIPFDEDFIIEDAVDGCEYGIDGMVFNGEFRLILTRKKLLTPPPYRQCVGYISLKKNDDLNTVLCGFMTRLISAISLKDGIVHADIIMHGDDPFVIEMSPRPSGHRLHNLFTPMVTGVDMISDYIDHLMNKRPEDHVTERDEVYIIRYFDMESEIKRIPDRESLIKKYSLSEYECNLTPGEKTKIKDGHSLMGRGFFILKGSSEKEVVDKAAAVLDEYV
ncbi:MAG: ATP-grasp domain-containing protein [Lachnospiraceae bacterium]|nr:ATP-grasp domain-containing protein [Lachnospiraceae bacterium]